MSSSHWKQLLRFTFLPSLIYLLPGKSRSPKQVNCPQQPRSKVNKLFLSLPNASSNLSFFFSFDPTQSAVTNTTQHKPRSHHHGQVEEEEGRGGGATCSVRSDQQPRPCPWWPEHNHGGCLTSGARVSSGETSSRRSLSRCNPRRDCTDKPCQIGTSEIASSNRPGIRDGESTRSTDRPRS